MHTKRDAEERLRSEIARLGPDKYQRRYDEGLRRRIAIHARARRLAGESMARIARSIGTSEPTLMKILRGSTGATRPARVPPRSRRSMLVPVTVKRERPLTPRFAPFDGKFAVRGPGGLLIEGLSVDEVAILISRVAACSG
jgi:hypothetical protein